MASNSRRTIAKANARIVVNGDRRASTRRASKQQVDRTSSEKKIHVVELFRENGDYFISFENYGMDIQLDTLRRYRTLTKSIYEIEDGDGYRVAFNLVQDDAHDAFAASLFTTIKGIQRKHPQPESFIFPNLESDVSTNETSTRATVTNRPTSSRSTRPLPKPPTPKPPAPVPPPKRRIPPTNQSPPDEDAIYENMESLHSPRSSTRLSTPQRQRSESTDSIDSGVSSTYYWICDKCERFNDLSSTGCFDCSEVKSLNPMIIILEIEVERNPARPGNVYTAEEDSSSQTQAMRKNILRKNNVDNWQCHNCFDKGTGYNAADNYMCVFCNTMRKDAWQCDGCLSLQPLCTPTCGICRKWRCTLCTWINGKPTRACASCSSLK